MFEVVLHHNVIPLFWADVFFLYICVTKQYFINNSASCYGNVEM